MPTEQRLMPDSASGGERGGEDGIHIARGRAGRARRIERAPDLPEDLGLTEDLRIEPGRDREEMTHRLRPVEPHQLAGECHPPRARQITEPRLVIVWPRPVELASIAGEEQQRRAAGLVLLGQQRVEFGGRERKLLTNANGRRMVADANDMERDFATHAPRVHEPPERDNTHPSGEPLRRNTEQPP
jgi:hypothetical protein